MHQGAGNHQAPALAIGQLSEGLISDRGEIQPFQQGPRCADLLGLGGLITAKPHRAEQAAEHHLQGNDHRWKTGFQLAVHHTEATAQLPEIDRAAAEQLQMRIGLHHRLQAALNQLHHGAFAGTVRSENGGGLPQPQLQVEVVDHGATAQPCFHPAGIEPDVRHRCLLIPRASARSRSAARVRSAGSPGSDHSTPDRVEVLRCWPTSNPDLPAAASD